MSSKIQIKRAYAAISPSDGYRIYIDRLWPQGLSHETFHYDLWEKDIAPSTNLREWFHADPEARWAEFQQKYIAELKANPSFQKLKDLIDEKPRVTLLFSSKDTAHNNAVVLQKALENE